MRALVTGASGFVGKHLTGYLQQLGYEVIGVAGPASRAEHLRSVQHLQAWESVDLRESMTAKRLLAKYQPDEVYHLAGIAVTHGVGFRTYMEANVIATRNVAEAILDSCGSECKMLFVSSGGVYARPEEPRDLISERTPVRPANDYGASKAAAEAVLWPLMHKGLNFRIARPFNHTGPGQQMGFVCPDLIERFRQAVQSCSNEADPLFIKVGRLNSVRDFTDVRDIVRAYVMIQKELESGEVMNVSSGKGFSVREIIQILTERVVQRKTILESDAELSGRDEMDVLIGDNSLLRRKTGWAPEITIEQTLKDLWFEAGRRS